MIKKDIQTDFLIVPGLYDSDANHWQTRWQQRFRLPRVVQPDWRTPDLDRWCPTLEWAVRGLPGPVIILAHSFGCVTAISAAANLRDKIVAALLVAPADPDKFGFDEAILRHPLSFPSIFVASRNDPWLAFDKAKIWAERWQSEFVDLGFAGHINSASGLGDWPLGWELAQSLVPLRVSFSAKGGTYEDFIATDVRVGA